MKTVLALTTLSPVVLSPAFLVPQVQNKFGDKGKLTDADTLQRLERYLREFIDWTICLQG